MGASITGGNYQNRTVNSEVMGDQFGHIVYTCLNAMLFNTTEIVRTLYSTA